MTTEKQKGKAEGFASIQIGRTKTGKTTFVRDIVKEVYEKDPYRDIFIFDVNKEYTDFYPQRLTNMEGFMNLIEPVKNSFILFEEATIFFHSNTRSTILMDKLVRKRHDNNIIFLNFHSWRSVPPSIFDMVDYVTIFKTNDTAEKIRKKCEVEGVLKAFDEVQKSKDKFERKSVHLYGA